MENPGSVPVDFLNYIKSLFVRVTLVFDMNDGDESDCPTVDGRDSKYSS